VGQCGLDPLEVGQLDLLEADAAAGEGAEELEEMSSGPDRRGSGIVD
jgi:hypothetical protein